MALVAAAFVPHPTILLPEVGGPDTDHLASTRAAFSRLDAHLAQLDAGTVIVVSPHGPAGSDQLPIRLVPRASGHLSRFGAARVALDLAVDVELTRDLIRSSRPDGFRLFPSDDRGLDHGTIVPLWLLPQTRAGKRFVFLGVTGWPLPRLEAFGRWLFGRLSERSAILLASGNLAHPPGQLEGIDWESIEGAGDCGLRSLAVLLGASSAAGLRAHVLSYEDPFGLGCAVIPA